MKSLEMGFAGTVESENIEKNVIDKIEDFIDEIDSIIDGLRKKIWKQKNKKEKVLTVMKILLRARKLINKLSKGGVLFDQENLNFDLEQNFTLKDVMVAKEELQTYADQLKQ